MCGIAGFVDCRSQLSREKWSDVLTEMGAAIHYRGPDAQGIWHSLDASVGFAHRRLKIVDLSDNANQPMTSPSGRYVICYNGEIYNHVDLRVTLDGLSSTRQYKWQTSSDTETLLATIDEWGLTPALHRCDGMFAFALWDKLEKKLFLVRDRQGEKPLYYGLHNGILFFGSDLNAFSPHPFFSPQIDARARHQLLSQGFIETPLSIYEGIQRQPAGTIVQFDEQKTELSKPEAYWCSFDLIEERPSFNAWSSEYEVIDHIQGALSGSINKMMTADVPVGIFLSSGLDSSVIAALAQNNHASSISTFSIGFEQEEFDESDAAASLAHHLGTTHHQIILSERQILDAAQTISSAFAEPFADASQIPTLLLAQFSSQHVTVALSGDGGDELFGGYNRHVFAHRYLNKLLICPSAFRQLMAGLLNTLSDHRLSQMSRMVSRLTGKVIGQYQFIEHCRRLSDVMMASDAVDAYDHIIRKVGSYASKQPFSAQKLAFEGRHLDIASLFMLLDFVRYLPDDVLCKSDRASMYYSLEVRAPFLSKDVIEAGFALPIEHKIYKGKGKAVLRALQRQLYPPHLLTQKKKGFTPPLHLWLNSSLTPWVNEMLSDSQLAYTSALDPEEVKMTRASAARNDQRAYHMLWHMTCYQAWAMKQKQSA